MGDIDRKRALFEADNVKFVEYRCKKNNGGEIRLIISAEAYNKLSSKNKKILFNAKEKF